MARVRNLKKLSHLRDTGFGQPYPRHGLILLWWFAHECVECVEINGIRRMKAQRGDPEHKDFGFHPFQNKEEILPDIDLPYYELGNLHNQIIKKSKTCTMPHYVTKNYDRDVRESNADRIVVSVKSDCNGKWFDSIYVTHHLGMGRFDEDSTYRISQGLIRKIQSMEWSKFIREVKIR